MLNMTWESSELSSWGPSVMGVGRPLLSGEGDLFMLDDRRLQTVGHLASVAAGVQNLEVRLAGQVHSHQA